MMSQLGYTYVDLRVGPYEFVKILDFKLIKQTNDHAQLSIHGIISEEIQDQYVEQADEQDHIQVSVHDGKRLIPLFQGVVTHLSVQALRQVRSMSIEASSSTILMDMEKKTRTFQNPQLSYQQLFTDVSRVYPGAHVENEATLGKSMGAMTVQYKETDWKFIRRLASRLHAPLLPLSTLNGMSYAVGVPDLNDTAELNEFNYTVKKNLKEFIWKSADNEMDIQEHNCISYEVTSGALLELGSRVKFKGRTLYVYRAEISMENGVFVNRYTLRDKQGFGCITEYPHSLVGASLFGNVLDIVKDKVKVHLQVDHAKPAHEAMWFPYSTVYSSPDGSGWYCMPEIGDEVRLYFPDEHEHHAFAASSVDLATSDPQKRSDPSVKSMSNKYGKQIVFRQGAVEIIANGRMLLRLTDDGGIEMNSDKKIAITAQEDIEIQGGSNVLIQGDEGIDLIQAGATLQIQDVVTISGGKVNIK